VFVLPGVFITLVGSAIQEGRNGGEEKIDTGGGGV